MGLTVLEVDIANPARPEKMVPMEFLIDSGAIYSVVPAKILDDLGIKLSISMVPGFLTRC